MTPERAPAPFVLDYADDLPFDPSTAPVVGEMLATGAALQGVAALSAGPGSALGRLARWVFGALFCFVLTVAAWNFVSGLFVSNPLLGGLALALTGAAVLVALVGALREVLAMSRMARLDHLRQQAAEAAAAQDIAAARKLVAALRGIYRNRGDLAWGQARLEERQAEVFDADALLALAEVELLAPLDAAARIEVESAARQVATVTALVPLALADVAIALFANLRMIRRVAEIYGGRSGGFGAWRLLRRVFGALVATGAVALTDDLLSSVAGGGVLAKLSRRFGEGVVNGALTARVGVAAMELCRPMPFVTQQKPAVSSLVARALGGLFGRGQG